MGLGIFLACCHERDVTGCQSELIRSVSLNITCSSVWHCLDKNLEVSPGTNTLTLICHGKGGMRAPGRCGRDTCPRERNPDAGHGFGPYATISPFVS